MSSWEQMHKQDLERIKSFRYMDDDFMTACLEDNFEGVGKKMQSLIVIACKILRVFYAILKHGTENDPEKMMKDMKHPAAGRDAVA